MIRLRSFNNTLIQTKKAIKCQIYGAIALMRMTFRPFCLFLCTFPPILYFLIPFYCSAYGHKNESVFVIGGWRKCVMQLLEYLMSSKKFYTIVFHSDLMTISILQRYRHLQKTFYSIFEYKKWFCVLNPRTNFRTIPKFRIKI